MNEAQYPAKAIYLIKTATFCPPGKDLEERRRHITKRNWSLEIPKAMQAKMEK